MGHCPGRRAPPHHTRSGTSLHSHAASPATGGCGAPGPPGARFLETILTSAHSKSSVSSQTVRTAVRLSVCSPVNTQSFRHVEKIPRQHLHLLCALLSAPKPVLRSLAGRARRLGNAAGAPGWAPAPRTPLRREQGPLKPPPSPHKAFPADEERHGNTHTRLSDTEGRLTGSRKASMSAKGTDSGNVPITTRRGTWALSPWACRLHA